MTDEYKYKEQTTIANAELLDFVPVLAVTTGHELSLLPY
jgi:hypothetical protein